MSFLLKITAKLAKNRVSATYAPRLNLLLIPKHSPKSRFFRSSPYKLLSADSIYIICGWRVINTKVYIINVKAAKTQRVFSRPSRLCFLCGLCVQKAQCFRASVHKHRKSASHNKPSCLRVCITTSSPRSCLFRIVNGLLHFYSI